MNQLSKCRFCSSSDVKVSKRVKSHHFKEQYSLYHCYNCLSYFFNLKEHQVDLESMYDELSTAEGRFKVDVAFKKNRVWSNQVKFIENQLGRTPKSIIDVGCRSGDFLMHFDKSVSKEGVELSKLSASVAEKRGIKVYQDFAENIKFEKTYEVVSCYALLEHLEHPLVLIENLRKITDNNGLLVIAIPLHECLKQKILSFLGVRWHMYSPPEHLNFFSTSYFNSIIENNGEFTLINKKITSGGLINPFRKIPLLNKAFSLLMIIWDASILNRLPIFDHMYLYYRKN